MQPENLAVKTDIEEEGEPQGIDGIIAQVDSYIAKPEMVTPETLSMLRADLEDLKQILEPSEEMPEPGPAGGLAAMIGGGR